MRVAHAEHPLIPAHGADAAPDLIGERLESEAVIRGGERGAERIARALPALGGGEDFDGFLETAREEVLEAVEGDG